MSPLTELALPSWEAVHPATVHACSPGLIPESYPSQRTRRVRVTPQNLSSIHLSACTNAGRAAYGQVWSAQVARLCHQTLGLVNGQTAAQVRQLPQWSWT